MGDEDDADAAAARLVNDALDGQHRGGIKAGGRLVQKQHLGVGCQRAGQCQALRLATRQQARGLIGLVGQADMIQQGIAPRHVLAARLQREVDIRGHRTAQQHRFLKDQRLTRGDLGRGMIAPADPPRRGRHQAVQKFQQQAFAGPVGPHDHGAAAGPQIKVHPVQHRGPVNAQHQVAHRQRQQRGGARRKGDGPGCEGGRVRHRPALRRSCARLARPRSHQGR